MNSPDPGLETLLELDGSVLEQEGGFWIKIEARQFRLRRMLFMASDTASPCTIGSEHGSSATTTHTR